MKGEINLLPARLVRERVRVVYLARGRQLVRLALGLASLMVVGQMSVLAFYLALARIGDAGQAVRASAGRDVPRAVAETNRLLAAIQTQAQGQIVWSKRLGEVLAVVAQPLTVHELGVEEQSNALVIEGTAPSAAAVETLQQSLEDLPWVQRVEAPLTNYVVKPEATFSLTVIGKQL